MRNRRVKYASLKTPIERLTLGQGSLRHECRTLEDRNVLPIASQFVEWEIRISLNPA